MSRRWRAQSEVTGSLLTAGIAVVITVVLVVLAFGLLEDTTEPAPSVDFDVADGADGLVLTHTHGDPIDTGDFRVVARNESGDRQRWTLVDGQTSSPDPTEMHVGQRRVFVDTTLTGPTVVQVFHDPSGGKVFEGRVTLTPPGNVAPTASFTATIADGDGDGDDEIVYDASASSDPDGTISYYEWDTTGDGNYDVNTTDPVYVKEIVWGTTTGEVELQVTDDDGANASVRKTNQPQTTPGFGAVAVLVAVLLGATLARRYR